MESYLTAEISPSAVRANLELLRGCLAADTKLCAVVKSDCYGLGVERLLGVISELADCLAVATAQEAVEIRDLGYGKPILLIFPPAAYASETHRREALEELIAREVTLTLVSSAGVSAVAAAADKLDAVAEVHVNIDTGMCRGGVPLAGAAPLVRRIRQQDRIHLAGLYTHFACADEADLTHTRGQLERFTEAVEACGGRDGLVLHAANSAATIQMPEAHLDMVRPGIAIYGYQSSDQMQKLLPLRPALRLWARLIQIKEVPAGSKCGYGLTHTFSRPGRVALVPVGYGDGYFRSLSNKATMRIAGSDVPVVGRVSMDQTIVDITNLPAAKVGDVVEIISNDPAAPHSVESLVRMACTIPHELITGIGPRARRVSLAGVHKSETRAAEGAPPAPGRPSPARKK